MRRILTVVLAGLGLTACGSSSQTPAQRLIGNWLYTSADGSSGLGATFRDDGTYTLVTLALTSTTTGDAEVEDGTYLATDTAFTATPTEWTCPGPDSIATVTYSFSGSDLIAVLSTAVISLVPNTSPADQAFVLTLGCFQSDGTFVTEALGPVSNQ